MLLTVSTDRLCSVDDTNLEFTIKIPRSYPLRTVTVDGAPQVVAEGRWRRWLLNCAMTVTSSEGSIARAIITWRVNAEKHFDGIEDCAICYSIVGSLDKALPTKQVAWRWARELCDGLTR